MKLHRTDDPDVYYAETDGEQLWCLDIIRWRIEHTRDDRLLLTAIRRDQSEAPTIDATELWRQSRKKTLESEAYNAGFRDGANYAMENFCEEAERRYNALLEQRLNEIEARNEKAMAAVIARLRAVAGDIDPRPN